jgi:hypothetical protein
VKIKTEVEIPEGRYCGNCMFMVWDFNGYEMCAFDHKAGLTTDCENCEKHDCDGCPYSDSGFVKIAACPALREPEVNS